MVPSLPPRVGRCSVFERGGKMASQKRAQKKKYFTAVEANAALPLVRAIVRDIAELAGDLRDRQDLLARVRATQRGSLAGAYKEEVHLAQAEIERDSERLFEYERELRELGIELKDYFTGLVD